MSELPRDDDAASSLESLKGIEGFYVLTAGGELGVYDGERQFHIDARLTDAFSDYIRRFLSSYRSEPEQHSARLAVVLRNAGRHPWGSATMVLEDATIQELYPVWGARRGELTHFQRRSKERSIFQGMELLLEYRSEALPDTPVFCPILFDRGTTVSSYPQLADTGCEPRERVAEVLNLIARLDVGTRQSRWVRELIRTMHEAAIRKERRRTSDFTLVDEPYPSEVRASAQRHPGQASSAPTPPPRGSGDTPGSAGADSPQARVSLLERFARLDQLDPHVLERLSEQVLVDTAPAGRVLVERGTSDEWLRLLVSGSVELEAADGGRKVIEGGTDDARYPIGNLLPYQHTVRALTPVKYLRLERAALDASRGPAAPRHSSSATPASPPRATPGNTAEPVAAPSLPPLPAPLVSLCRLVDRQAVSVEGLTEIAVGDLAMERALLAVARESRGVAGADGEAGTCHDAITRIGTANAARIMLTAGFAPVFLRGGETLRPRLQAHWEDALRIACIAFVLGSMALRFTPERAYLAGLLHGAGALALMRSATQEGASGPSPRAQGGMGQEQRRAGSMVLRSWGLSAEIVSCAAEAEDWYRNPAPEPDYCDLVMVARLHATIGAGQGADAPRMDELPAYRKLAPGGELTPRLSLQILSKAKELEDQAQQVVRG